VNAEVVVDRRVARPHAPVLREPVRIDIGDPDENSCARGEDVTALGI
jgi:hypothetical protein